MVVEDVGGGRRSVHQVRLLLQKTEHLFDPQRDVGGDQLGRQFVGVADVGWVEGQTGVDRLQKLQDATDHLHGDRRLHVCFHVQEILRVPFNRVVG